MKQLLHTSTDGCHIVVAFHDTVYYYDHRKRRGTIYELLPTKRSVNNNATTGSKHHHENDATSSVAANQSTKAPVPEPVDPHEVQAVAVVTTNNNNNHHSTIWCAVARYDKSLTLYSFEEATAPNEDDMNSADDITKGESSNVVEMKMISPYLMHHTAKRVSSLAFATVPRPTTTTDSCLDLTVIVAGDVVGDANAYSLQQQQQQQQPAVGDERHDLDDDGDDHDNDAADDMPDQIVTKHRRLLLGHTASMLTSVHIVTESMSTTESNNIMNDNVTRSMKRQFILTSDRDEKIRVSRFPDTFCIEGYLLGHTAFVSSVAPIPSAFVSNGKNRCVSVGGDCTIRLWDYSTCHELAVASTDVESIKTETEQSTFIRANDDVTDKNEAVESDSPTTGPIPTKVAVATDGSMITTIYDECLTMDFWLVRTDHNNGSDDSTCTFDRIFRWTCPGQPFGMAFLDDKHFVLVMQEPYYMQQFKIICNDDTAVTTIVDVVAVDSDPCRTIQQSADERDILMTDALLEKDEYGCLKMGKMSERRGGAAVHPWNNFSRKETYADRLRRFRKRRREERLQQQQQQQLEESSQSQT